MSFQDLEAGLRTEPAYSSGANLELELLPKKISQKIFKISSGISTISRLVKQLGTARDTQDLRNHLHDSTEKTREIIKLTTSEIKQLTSQTYGLSSNEIRQRKTEQQKLAKDFQKVLEQFHSIQRLSAEKSREVVNYMVMAQDDSLEDSEEQPLIADSAQQFDLPALDTEVEYNQDMIHEREREIRDIEQGITELNEVFRDLGTFVNEQQGLLDNIESNVSSTAVNTHQAANELQTANKYQKRSRKGICFISVLLFIISVIFIVVLSS